MRVAYKLSYLICALASSACASTPIADFTRIGEVVYAAKDAGAPIQVFSKGETPKVPFDRIAIVEVRKATYGVKTSQLDEVLEDMKHKARLAGADAIINIQNRQSREMEHSKFYAVGIAIRYK